MTFTGTRPTRLAHVSDPHFGSEEPGLAASLQGHLNTGGYDLVMVSGDLTMAARTREYRAARAFLDGLAPDTLCVPGNHDVTPYKLAERFLRPWKRYRTHIAASLEPEWRSHDVAVIGVNTARRALLKLDWSRGSISRRQIARLSRRLGRLPPHVFRVVVAHHPFIADEGLDTPTPLVARAAKALAAFSGGEVDVIASGHLHRTYTAAFEVGPEDGAETVVEGASAEGAPLSTRGAPATGPRLVVIQAGTALSVRRRGEPNAFNRIDVANGRLEVRRVHWTGDGWQADREPMAAVTRPASPATAPAV